MARRILLSVLRRVCVASVLVALALAIFGCAGLNKRQEGAIIGAPNGGTAGVIIGSQMDQQAKALKQSIAGATIERVGEGIQVTIASGLLYEFDSGHALSGAAINVCSLAST